MLDLAQSRKSRQGVSPSSPSRVESLESRVFLAAELLAGFSESEFVRGFNTPSSMEFAPDGRLFVTEKGGAVKVVKDGEILPTPFLQVNADTDVERGLQSIVFDPDFEENGYVYVYYARKGTIVNRLSRFTASSANPDRVDPASEKVMLDNILTPTGFHNGGAMHFGPDGMLYLGVGDGGSRSADAQKLDSLNGKILRLNVGNYPGSVIPSDNPFVNVPGARKEVFALGFRNPFTSAVDPVTGRFYVNDVLTDKTEEVNYVRAGRNYGWPEAEGDSSNPDFTDPFYSWPHDSVGQGAATGGVFYRGNQFPASYRGDYFVADFTQRFIRRVDENGNGSNFATNVDRAIDLDVGPDGSLYYLSAFGDGYQGDNRPVMKISYTGSGNRAPQAQASANRTSGGTPLTVEFSGNGSSDPDGDGLSFRWDFGDGETASGRNVTYTFDRAGTYEVVLTVNDGKGGSDQSQAIPVTVGNNAPDVRIELPKTGGLFRAGDTVRFAGTASDREDGSLSADALEWEVVFHHRDHTHPFVESVADTKDGSFRVPVEYEPDAVQFYRVRLTARDSAGLESSTFVDIKPRTSRITLRSNVEGVTLSLDNQPRDGGVTLTAVEGMRRTLSAPATQVIGGKTYEFVGWSDGGEAEHAIRVPGPDTVYTATYRERSVGGGGGGNGLTGVYFDNPGFKGKGITRTDRYIDFNWKRGSPLKKIEPNSFSVRWTGRIEIPSDGRFSFFALADDNVRVWIDNKLVIDAFKNKGAQEVRGRVNLDAGLHDVRMDYVERSGKARARLRWAGPDVRKTVVPRRALLPGEGSGAPSQQGLRAGWSGADVGSVGVAGTTSFSNNTFTVRSAGGDIEGGSDSFHFAYQSLVGGGEIIARIGSQQETDPWAKSGVMIRNSAAANAAHASLFLTPDNRLAFRRRTSGGATSVHAAGGPSEAPQ